jgi:hypothetical protein
LTLEIDTFTHLKFVNEVYTHNLKQRTGPIVGTVPVVNIFLASRAGELVAFSLVESR